MQKKLKKPSKIEKFFIARNTFKYLSLRQQHHLRCFGHVSGQALKKELGQLSQKSLTPDMQKNSKKHQK